MTKDYRKGSPPPRHRGPARRGTCAFWFVAGAILGAFGVGYAWMTQDQQQGSPVAEQPADPGNQQAEPALPEPQKPTFNFPSLLEEEVVVLDKSKPPKPAVIPEPGTVPVPGSRPDPADTTDQPTESASAKPPPQASAGPNSYILQVGSFRKNKDAERLKAQLALIGIQTSIEPVTVANGKTYHRVRTGAYSKADAKSINTDLKSKGHKPMMMRAK